MVLSSIYSEYQYLVSNHDTSQYFTVTGVLSVANAAHHAVALSEKVKLNLS